ncbi:MAG: hypothetical protein ACRD23_15835 [Terriglobales bacterium]
MKKLLMAMLALVMMAGCSSETSRPAQVEKPQPKPAEFVTGRVAFQKLYIAARGWARDAQPYRLESTITEDSKGKEGKSSVWRASFASPLQHGVKAYTWSGEVASDRGINPGTEDTYSPTNTSTQIFDVAFLKVDSDQALEVAQKHGGEKLLAKEPDTPIVYMLDWSGAANQLIWHVIYGINRDEYKLRVAVNASSGDFVRVEK